MAQQKTPTPKDERREYLMSLIGKLTPENQRKLLDYIDLLEGSQQKVIKSSISSMVLTLRHNSSYNA